jgi:CHAT domain-containing protein/tetratricopeptide (TPR) repeat protein
MLVDRLAANGLHRLVVVGVFLAVLGLLGMASLLRADPPKPLTQEQQARLKERDRFFAEVRKQYKAGKLAEAVAAMEKVVGIERTVFGKAHARVADALVTLAKLQEERQDYNAAIKAREDILGIYRKVHGAYDWRTTDARWELDGLGRRARLSVADRKQLTEAGNLNQQENTLSEKGRYQEALLLAQKVVEVYKRLMTENHPAYADRLNNLAILYQIMGDYRSALPLFQQALQLRKKLLTENHPDYAESLNNLAVLYQALGDYRRALPLLQQAPDLRKKLLTENHPDYAQSLNNLAILYHAMGDYPSALSLHQQALALRKKLLTEDPFAYAESLNNLAALYKAMGDYREALPLLQQARDLLKKLLTENHLSYAASLGNLATLYQSMGDYRGALPLLQQLRDLARKRVTENHPTYAASLTHLAVLYQDMGDYRSALPLFQQACTLRKRLLSENHPSYAASLHNQAGILHCLGKAGEGFPLARQSIAIKKRLLDDTFGALSDRQRLDFARQQRSSLFLFLTLARAVKSPATEVYPHVLVFKGILAARQAEEQLARDQPQLKPRLDELRQVCASLANVAYQTPATKKQREDWRKRFDDLEKDKEKLEVRLAQQSETFRLFLKLRDATVKDIAAALPANTAFIDFLFYTHSTPPPEGKGKMHTETRLLAFVLTRGQSPIVVPLGPAGPIERAVAAWRQAAVKGESPNRPGQELNRRLWGRLGKHPRGVDAVLIAPDGALSGLPFAALPGSKPGSYLCEELAIGYVTSGRQLLELRADKDASRGRGLLTVGDLAYGKPAAAPPASAAFASLDFEPLPGTKVEAQRIARLYRQAFPTAQAPRLLSGKTTDAARLKAELPPTAPSAPRYLHLATHAFFEAPLPQIKTKGQTASADAERQDRLYRRNPLLLSGLVLSGANASYEKGILTAEEVSSLDLRGVDLAVLSACDTGLGRVDPGEGVLGLQRGFQRAGARSMAVSLWSVNDAATSVLMEEFYTNLWVKKLPKLQALQQAQLKVLRNPDQVIKRGRELGALLAKEGVSSKDRAWLALRGIYKKVEELPDGGKIVELKRSPPAWWAAFVLYGDAK